MLEAWSTTATISNLWRGRVPSGSEQWDLIKNSSTVRENYSLPLQTWRFVFNLQPDWMTP